MRDEVKKFTFLFLHPASTVHALYFFLFAKNLFRSLSPANKRFEKSYEINVYFLTVLILKVFEAACKLNIFTSAFLKINHDPSAIDHSSQRHEIYILGVRGFLKMTQPYPKTSQDF